jgi:hypothetical protein
MHLAYEGAKNRFGLQVKYFICDVSIANMSDIIIVESCNIAIQDIIVKSCYIAILDIIVKSCQIAILDIIVKSCYIAILDINPFYKFYITIVTTTK